MGNDTNRRPTAVVGIGSSAGGLKALRAFFEAVPADTELAFVVVNHQRAGSETSLPELLQNCAQIPVRAVEEAVELEAGHVYVQQGGRELHFEEGRIIADEPQVPVMATIDRFFRLLAQAWGSRAIGVILSGGGSDGTIGVREIKIANGYVFAQDPEDAEFGDMPEHAIEAALVDSVATAGELPDRIDNFVEGPFFGELDGSRLAHEHEDQLTELFELLREHTGAGFSGYKRTTIGRRIERRMNVVGVPDLSAYLEVLRRDRGELDDLFGELLIGVTNFFRDPELWEAFAENALLPMIESKSDGDTLRAWIAGCSTGEEAYTLAMYIWECAEQVGRKLDFQIYATDLNHKAIDMARRGLYPSGVAADLQPERLAHFFRQEESGYRVVSFIREMLVFAPQDLLEDPPFTQLDILTCRNVLIYFDKAVQERMIPLFHYALREGGTLFLGSSESLGTYDALFEPIDKKARVYRRLTNGDTPAIPVVFPASGQRSIIEPRGRRGSLDRAERLLLEELAPASVICGRDGRVVHIHGRGIGDYLEPAPGFQDAATIFDMAREGLGLELQAVSRDAFESRPNVVRRRDITFRTGDGWKTIDITGRVLERNDSLSGLVLLTFEPSDENTVPGEKEIGRIGKVADLERELQESAAARQQIIEELVSTNQELQSTNEELQSTNEELQSTNEELETSKEEVQSLNEELRTVNDELKNKVDQLLHINDDLQNFLQSTDIATLFLDMELTIKQFTEAATRIIKLIDADIGRPLTDLRTTVDTDVLVRHAHEVLDTLQVREVELRSDDEKIYLVRFVPYRTSENVIDGVVISFVDVTRLRSLQQSRDQLEVALEAAPVVITAQDTDLRFRWSSGELFDVSVTDIVGQDEETLLDEKAAAESKSIKEQAVEHGEAEGKLRVDGIEYEIFCRATGSPPDSLYCVYILNQRQVDELE